jgi:hypothetical protein
MVEVVRRQTLLHTPGFASSSSARLVVSLPHHCGLHPRRLYGELHACEHLRLPALDNSVAIPSIPSALRNLALSLTGSHVRRLLRPLLTSRSGSTPLPFQDQGEISPGKNALLQCTTAGSTPPCLDHKSFAVFGPFALLDSASYPVLVHRLAASLHASFPHSVALMQLRFTSFAVINLREDFHLQECAHTGRTKKKGPEIIRALCGIWWSRGELNPRPQVLRRQFYMFIRLI